MKKLSNYDKMLVGGGAVGAIGYYLGAYPPSLLVAVPPVVAVGLAFLLGVGLTFAAYEAGK